MIKIGNSGVKNKPYRLISGGFLTLSTGEKMFIPKDYHFDNASIPKITKWLYDTFEWEFLNYKYTAFLVHDWMYNYRSFRLSRGEDVKPVDRGFADNEMKHWMRIHGDSEFKIFIWFFFVRLFGWLFWGKI